MCGVWCVCVCVWGVKAARFLTKVCPNAVTKIVAAVVEVCEGVRAAAGKVHE